MLNTDFPKLKVTEKLRIFMNLKKKELIQCKKNISV